MNREPIEFAMRQLETIVDSTLFSTQFSLSHWGNQLLTHPLDQPEDPKCGFSGCFIGWAIHQQWFDKWGLKLAFSVPWDAPASTHVEQTEGRLSIFPRVSEDSSEAWLRYATEKDGGQFAGRQTEMALYAVANLFGIDRSLMDYIIYEEHYEDPDEVTPLEVRDRLGKLLEHGPDRFLELMIDFNERRAQRRADNCDGPQD